MGKVPTKNEGPNSRDFINVEPINVLKRDKHCGLQSCCKLLKGPPRYDSIMGKLHTKNEGLKSYDKL